MEEDGLKLTSSGPDLDVESGDSQLLAPSRDVLGSQHSSVRGGLVAVSLDLHTTGDTADSFAATANTRMVSNRSCAGSVSSQVYLSASG